MTGVGEWELAERGAMRDTGAKAWRPRVLTLVVGENSPLEILSLSASRMAYLASTSSTLLCEMSSMHQSSAVSVASCEWCMASVV